MQYYANVKYGKDVIAKINENIKQNNGRKPIYVLGGYLLACNYKQKILRIIQ